MQQPGSEAWYREPWPWILMAGPVLVILAGIVTVYLAVRSEDGLVVDDYYKQGLAINATLARNERARALGIKGQLQLSAERSNVQVTLSGSVPGNARLRLRLVHPTRGGEDQTVLLLPLPGGNHGAAIRRLGQGSWNIQIEDEVSGWRIVGTLLPRLESADLVASEDR